MRETYGRVGVNVVGGSHDSTSVKSLARINVLGGTQSY